MAPVAITSAQKWRGVNTALTTEIEVGPDSSHRACITEIQAKVTIENESGEQEVVAGYKSYTLDKSVRSRRAPAWLKEILLEPFGYKHDRLSHSVPDDSQDDLTKTFQLMFDREGNVKEQFSPWADILTGDQIHYIDTFEVAERFRGTGMARVAMKCYKESLRRLDSFEGTIILTPAGLRSVREKMLQQPRPAGRPVKSFLEIEDALVEGYKKDGFKVWRRGDRAQQGAALTIMGMSIARQNSTASVSVRDLQPEAEDPFPIDHMRQLSIMPSAQRLQTEQQHQTTTTATTEPNDGGDTAMGGSDQSSTSAAQAGAGYHLFENSNNASAQALPIPAATSYTSRNANTDRPRSQQRRDSQRVSRMVVELRHKHDENGVNPHLQPDDGRRYQATNGARYQLVSGTKAQWIKKDLSGASPAVSGPATNASMRPSLRPKRRIEESQVIGGGFKQVSNGSDRLLITTGMDDIPASKSAELIDGWHQDCFWAVEDFVDERLSQDGVKVTQVLIDWAAHEGCGTKWEPTWEDFEMLNDHAKELYQKWRIDTGRALSKKRRIGE